MTRGFDVARFRVLLPSDGWRGVAPSSPAAPLPHRHLERPVRLLSCRSSLPWKSVSMISLSGRGCSLNPNGFRDPGQPAALPQRAESWDVLLNTSLLGWVLFLGTMYLGDGVLAHRLPSPGDRIGGWASSCSTSRH